MKGAVELISHPLILIFRFRNNDGQIHVILGEWKYTEEYKNTKCKALGSSGATRLRIYKPMHKDSGLRLVRNIKYEVWDQIAPEKRFRHINSENLIIRRRP